MTIQFQTGSNSLGNATWADCGERTEEFLVKSCAYKNFDRTEVLRRLAGGFTVGYDLGYNGVLCLRDAEAVAARKICEADATAAANAKISADRAAAAALANDRG